MDNSFVNHCYSDCDTEIHHDEQLNQDWCRPLLGQLFPYTRHRRGYDECLGIFRGSQRSGDLFYRRVAGQKSVKILYDLDLGGWQFRNLQSWMKMMTTAGCLYINLKVCMHRYQLTIHILLVAFISVNINVNLFIMSTCHACLFTNMAQITLYTHQEKNDSCELQFMCMNQLISWKSSFYSEEQ